MTLGLKFVFSILFGSRMNFNNLLCISSELANNEQAMRLKSNNSHLQLSKLGVIYITNII